MVHSIDQHLLRSTLFPHQTLYLRQLLVSHIPFPIGKDCLIRLKNQSQFVLLLLLMLLYFITDMTPVKLLNVVYPRDFQKVFEVILRQGPPSI